MERRGCTREIDHAGNWVIKLNGKLVLFGGAIPGHEHSEVCRVVLGPEIPDILTGAAAT